MLEVNKKAAVKFGIDTKQIEEIQDIKKHQSIKQSDELLYKILRF